MSLFVYLFIFRVIFYLLFVQLEDTSSQEIQDAFLLGIRFDIKLAVLSIFPVAFLVFIINHRFFRYAIYKKISVTYLTIIYFVITLFYLFDFVITIT